MAKFDSKKVLAVHCPRCGAKPGEHCVSKHGKPTRELHTVRKGVVYRQYIKSSSGANKRGVKMPSIKITAIYLQDGTTPQQGEALVGKTRVVWAREGAKYRGWTMSDDDWAHVESGEDAARLMDIWLVTKAKEPYIEFFHEDANWGATG